jgi:hypothetical protein
MFFLVCLGFMSYSERRGGGDSTEDGIRPSPYIPCLGGASSITGGRVELCLRRISLDLVGVLSNLRFSSLAMAVALV